MRPAPILASVGALFSSAFGAQTKRGQIVNSLRNPVFYGRLDPIVSPGVVSNHVHTVFGGGAFGAEMTKDQALKAKCTANDIKPDKSNYWLPSLYFHAPNGTFYAVQAREYKVYYVFEQSDDDVVPFPSGLHLVAGDAWSRTPPGQSGHNIDPYQGPVIPYEIQCPDTGVRFTDKKCDGYGGLRQNIYFPSCYDPAAGLTSYADNSAYSSSEAASDGAKNCPAGWLHVPQLNLEVYWDTAPFDGSWTPGAGHVPWVLAHGDPVGAGSHGDFVAGWDEGFLARAIASCSSGTGNGVLADCFPDERVPEADAAACTVSSPVDEAIWGPLDALPGCNPVQAGPGRASPRSGCGAPTALGRGATQFTDLTAAAGWEYHGCFTDAAGGGRALGYGVDVPGLTIEGCIEACAGAAGTAGTTNFTVAGVEWGRECYCGTGLDVGGGNGLPSALCSQPCEGDPRQVCGAPRVLSVYRACDGVCENGSGPVADGQGSV